MTFSAGPNKNARLTALSLGYTPEQPIFSTDILTSIGVDEPECLDLESLAPLKKIAFGSKIFNFESKRKIQGHLRITSTMHYDQRKFIFMGHK